MVHLDLEFEWDLNKEAENYKKHRCSFTEAVESFADNNGIQIIDIKHSMLERRFYWVGKTSTGRIITTWFTKRGAKIRIIGAAELRRFRRLYETSKIE